MAENERRRDAELAYSEYVRYAKSVQGWVVAYAVGIVALFATKPEFLRDLPRDVKIIAVGLLFAAIGCQVLLAVINKYLNWLEAQTGFRPADCDTSRWWGTIKRLAECSWLIWVDVVCDLSSLVLLGSSSVILIWAVLGP